MFKRKEKVKMADEETEVLWTEHEELEGAADDSSKD